jgi:hypothetical protein
MLLFGREGMKVILAIRKEFVVVSNGRRSDGERKRKWIRRG